MAHLLCAMRCMFHLFFDSKVDSFVAALMNVYAKVLGAKDQIHIYILYIYTPFVSVTETLLEQALVHRMESMFLRPHLEKKTTPRV